MSISLSSGQRPSRKREGRKSDLRAAVGLTLIAMALGVSAKAAYIPAKAEVAQLLLKHAFTQSVATGQPVKAWAWADTWPVAKLQINRIGAEAIVLKGASGEALAFGPSLLDETARIGARGTTVIAAHRDTHFAFLKDVVTGDVISLTRADGLRFDYRVTGLRVADADASGIDRHAPGFHLVLSTCYPFDAVLHGKQRYLVEAEMVK
jgi:sortase A